MLRADMAALEVVPVAMAAVAVVLYPIQDWGLVEDRLATSSIPATMYMPARRPMGQWDSRKCLQGHPQHGTSKGHQRISTGMAFSFRYWVALVVVVLMALAVEEAVERF